MSTLSSVSLSSGSCVRVCGRGRARFRTGIMFPQPNFPNSDTVTPSRHVLLDHFLGPSPGHMVCSLRVFASLTPLGVGPVILLEAESNSCFGIIFQIFSDTILEQGRLCLCLNETKFKVHSLQKDASIFEIQKGVLIEQIKTLQSELKAIKAEGDSLKIVAEQQADASLSDRKQQKDSSTASDVSFQCFCLATKILSKLPVYWAKETSELCFPSDPPQRRWTAWGNVSTNFVVFTLGYSLHCVLAILFNPPAVTARPPSILVFEFLKHMFHREV